MREKHYVNLSNGILAIEEYNLTDYSFIRIQSTMCEQNQMVQILNSIPADMLMNLALDDTICHVYDYGSRGGACPRAFWFGLEWVKYVLHRIWFKTEYMPMKGKSQQNYFREEFRKLTSSERKVFKYYRKWIPETCNRTLNIKTHYKITELDGKYRYLNLLLTKEREHD